MDREGVVKTYDRWAPVYDLVFGTVFEKARKAAIAACEEVGGRVLEVGVGTGISLPYYSNRCRIVGVDISGAMLEVARQRVADLRMTNVEELAIMDVQDLQYETASFDVVTAQYVVNTVPDPEAALDEFMRVLRPGGELIVVNRVGAESGARLKVEKLLEPVVERLGWRSDISRSCAFAKRPPVRARSVSSSQPHRYAVALQRSHVRSQQMEDLGHGRLHGDTAGAEVG